jgi:hypothetical protein
MSTPGNRITLRLACASPQEAKRFVAALAPDNGGHLTATADGATLVLDAAAEAPLGLLRTIEDALQCLHAAGLRST